MGVASRYPRRMNTGECLSGYTVAHKFRRIARAFEEGAGLGERGPRLVESFYDGYIYPWFYLALTRSPSGRVIQQSKVSMRLR